MRGPELYVRRDSPLHRLDARAKLIALAGVVGGAALCPVRPPWPALALGGLLAAGFALGRVLAATVARRLLPLALVIGGPLALSRLGGEATRLAGETFALKSGLIAAAFLLLTATTRAEDLLDAAAGVPLLAGPAGLAGFILRGVHLLGGEVVRANRAWRLRAPRAGARVRLGALCAASVSLLGRAAARSERVGAAMALRGFQGRLPPPPGRPLARRELGIGLLVVFASLAVAGVGRWL